MKTILLLTASVATAAFATPTYQGQLSGANGYGSAVASDGFNLAVSSYSTLDFYQWNGTAWKLITHITTNVNLTGLAIYKTSALAKSSNGVFAFELSGSTWTHTQSIAIADGTGLYLGKSLSLYTNTAAVGAPNYNSGQGRVYILGRSSAGSPWRITQIISSPNTTADYFGGVVNLGVAAGSIHYLLASAPYNNGAMGTVYAYQQSGFTFSAAGSIPSPASGVGRFGESIGGEASMILIGAPADAGFLGTVHVYAISFSGGAISATQTQSIPAVAGVSMLFGEGVALTSTYAIISSRSTLTYYPVSGGVLGTGSALFVPAYSGIWGTAMTSVSGYTFAGDANTNGGAGAVSWYK